MSDELLVPACTASDFVSKRYEEQQLAQGIQKLVAESQAFTFLHEEEELYTVADLKEICVDHLN